MQAQRLPAARGFSWLTEGFLLFRRNPPLLTLLTLSYLLIVLAVGMLQPVGPFLLPLLLPALTTLVANGCRALDLGLTRQALTSGLAEQRGPLLRLGFLHLAGTLAVLAIDLLLEGGGWSAFQRGMDPETVSLTHMLRLMLIASPLLLAFWFAPLLTAWDRVPAAKSLFFSFVAAWRNWRAFLAYGAAVMLIGVFLPGLILVGASLLSATLGDILSIALRLLLVLVFAPVLMASVYLSYRDVFVPPPAVHG
ncbi:hypothetical protein GALL_202810 [mine drainage metagenome]|uniref:Transmembrane protein n=1 Tax=mine drainage metagenome TaxID=410659 RepID=A0A1J5SBR7_9ZZZZ